jgi:hypothetical protein
MPREHRASVGSVAQTGRPLPSGVARKATAVARTGRPLPSGLARKATAVAALSVAATVRAGARLPYRTDRCDGIHRVRCNKACCTVAAERRGGPRRGDVRPSLSGALRRALRVLQPRRALPCSTQHHTHSIPHALVCMCAVCLCTSRDEQTAST